MLWLILGAFAALAAGVLVFGVLRRPRGHAARIEYDLEVYRAQLEELDREHESGLISKREVAAARVEIQRRILAADRAAEGGGTARRKTREAVPAAIIAAVPLAALALYVFIGSPQTPSVPFAGRPAQPAPGDATGRATLPDVAPMMAQLRQRLAENPNDLPGWVMLGRGEVALGNHQAAVLAFERAIALAGDQAELYGAKAEAMIMAAQGRVTPAARASLQRSLDLDPGDPRARFYMAIADEQAGNLQGALDRLAALLWEAPAEASWFATVRQRAAGLAARLDLDPDAVLPEARAATENSAEPSAGEVTPGPSREDMAAASEMMPEQQKEMIRGMVGNLAERLKDAPDDLRGWRMLARSYGVLGEADQAAEAYRRVLALDPVDTDALYFLGEAASAQGDKDKAAEYWTRLLAQLTPGGAEHALVRERLDRLDAAN